MFLDTLLFAALPAFAFVFLVVVLRTRSRTTAGRFRHRLGKPLLLAHNSDLSTGTDTIEAPAGTPYRVISVNGRTVLIELRHADGTLARGYTTSSHVKT